MRLRRLCLGVLLASAAVACGGAPPQGDGRATGAAADRARASNTAASPEQLIARFGPSAAIGPQFSAINSAARTDAAVLRRAALARLHDPNPEVHYAAVYALALTADTGAGVPELAGLLSSPTADDRLLSAGALAGLGDKRAVPVLIAALDDPTELAYRDPPEHAFEFARKQLIWFTRQTFGLKDAASEPQVAASKPAWEKWWRTAGASIHFDPQTRRFTE